MKAKVTDPNGWRWAPEGHTVVTEPFGTVLEGHAAELAVEARAAKRIMQGRKKKDAPENKAVAALENKGAGDVS